MKKIVSILLISILVLSNLTFLTFANEDIKILINNEELITDVKAQMVPVYDENNNYVGDRTLLPIRAISEKLNCDVYWDEANEGITIYRNNNLYIMWLNKNMAFHLNGLSLEKGYNMDIPPLTINDRTMVPVRAVAELLGANVKWIDETSTVEITYDIGDLEENEGAAEKCLIYEQLLLEDYDLFVNYVSGTLDKITGKIVLESNEEIKFELYPQLAELTVNNFVFTAKAGLYNNTIIHRVIKGFVIQGGGFYTNFEPVDMPTIPGEFILNGYLNLIPHRRGVLSLARAENPDSGSSQFFIVQEDARSLDGSYATFGMITEGMEIVDKICEAETDEYDIPLKDIVVKTVIIDE